MRAHLKSRKEDLRNTRKPERAEVSHAGSCSIPLRPGHVFQAVCFPWKSLEVTLCEICNKSSHPEMTASDRRGSHEKRCLSLPNK